MSERAVGAMRDGMWYSLRLILPYVSFSDCVSNGGWPTSSVYLRHTPKRNHFVVIELTFRGLYERIGFKMNSMKL